MVPAFSSLPHVPLASAPEDWFGVKWMPGCASLAAGTLADALSPVSFAGSVHVLRLGHSV